MMADRTTQHFCETTGCEQSATLQCPTCLKIGIKDSYFCNQECFKGFWSQHKQKHKKTVSQITGEYNPWPHFQFTGPLRPFPRSSPRTVPARITRPDYAETGESSEERRAKSQGHMRQLTAEEIVGMRKACRLGREVLDIGARAVKPGVSTDEIDRLVHEACIERDCYPSPLNYNQFPKSCCTSVNEIICHGIPDKRELIEGDICNVDISVYHGGFHSDLNETMFVGKVDERSQKLVQTAYECMMAGIRMVFPGVRYREVGSAIQRTAQNNGFSVVRTYCGHGINQLFHTVPNVPHYAKNKAVGVMKPGHTFTIEPMINEGTWRDVTWPDDWTSATADGKRSAQFEQTLLVTDTGYEILTARPDEGGKPHFMTQSI